MGAYWFSSFMDEGEQFRFGELIVHEDHFIRDAIGQGHLRKMNSDGFIAAPGYVMVDYAAPISTSSSRITACEDYIRRGCTQLLIQHPVNSIRRYRTIYHSFLAELGQLPVDYMIVPVITSSLVTPDMIRFFARERCPFIQIELDTAVDLEEVAWEWLVQAQSLLRIPFSIVVKKEENSEYIINHLWPKKCAQYGMIKLTDPQLEERVTPQNLRDTGIFPNKGGFKPGGYADYNLFWQEEDQIVDGQDQFIYHGAVPDITVMRGMVLQVNQEVTANYQGKQQKVSIYKHFV
ncbi:hypothetical protein Q7A53_02800 [Halobacillus rhizosphaerae]|uniref:hypothetical protein n=1 Tax=Halobacillus rhizosphaerae TaxID=3064889 RepID=UPI00398B4E1A